MEPFGSRSDTPEAEEEDVEEVAPSRASDGANRRSNNAVATGQRDTLALLVVVVVRVYYYICVYY